jgi:hypothetical protein
MAEETAPTPDEVLRYASDTLHTIRPQPASILIAEALHELKAKLTAPVESEAPAKDFAEGISRIEAKVAKLQPPLKHKPDFKSVLEASKPHEAAEAKNKKAS